MQAVSSKMGNAVTAQAAMGQRHSAPSPRLVRAAHEFEGQMMKELLKPMTERRAADGRRDDDSDSARRLRRGAGRVCLGGMGQALSEQRRLRNCGSDCEEAFPFQVTSIRAAQGNRKSARQYRDESF